MKRLVHVFFTEPGFVQRKVSPFSKNLVKDILVIWKKEQQKTTNGQVDGICCIQEMDLWDNIYNFSCEKQFLSSSRLPLNVIHFFCSFDWKIIGQLISVFMKDCYLNARNDNFIVTFSLLSQDVLIIFIVMVVNSWIISSYLGTQVSVAKDVRSSNLMTGTVPFVLSAFDCSLTIWNWIYVRNET